MSTFLDTSAVFAILDRDDRFHATAREAWADLVEGEAGLLTSNYVLVECFALLRGRLGLDALRSFQGDLLPIVEVEWVTPEDHEAAVQALMTAGRRGLSLVDCVSFRIMRRLRIVDVFSFDEDFRDQGFTLLPG